MCVCLLPIGSVSITFIDSMKRTKNAKLFINLNKDCSEPGLSLFALGKDAIHVEEQTLYTTVYWDPGAKLS